MTEGTIDSVGSWLDNTLPAGTGAAFSLRARQRLRISQITGTQVVDTWAFATDLTEHLSMEHTRTALQRITPRSGDDLFSNLRRPLLQFEEDTSPGAHDTLIAACDVYRYQALGCQDYHRNCADNLREAARAAGLGDVSVPSPLNLFMNVPVDSDGELSFAAPTSRPHDRVTLRALRDVVVVLSTCPQDLVPVNGIDQVLSDVAVSVSR